MKILSKNYTSKKKSFLSLVLAGVMSLSFNYAPISLVANEIKSANAYKSSTTQSYYSSSTTNEANMSAGNYPTALEEYFKGSDKNFNIGTYYSSRYMDIYGAEFEKYLRKQAAAYVTTYEAFLEMEKTESLYDYYTANAADLNTTHKITDFKGYAEYFVSTTTSWKDASGTDFELVNLFDKADDYYKSKFYNAFANSYTGNQESISSDENNNYDGLAEKHDFYKDSLQYNRLKSAIDKYIEQTIAIYSFDGTTQNKTVAGIIADDAPASMSYYYKDNDYDKEPYPIVNYDMTSYTDPVTNTTTSRKTVYYFGNASDLEGKNGYESVKNFISVNDVSVLNKDLLRFIPIKSSDGHGYIDDDNNVSNGTNIITYYKYESTAKNTYETTNSVFDIYVLDTDGITDDEKATYDSLFYNVITSEELAEDAGKFFVQVPYFTSLKDYFFEVSGLTSDSSTQFTNYCELFTDENGKSRIYLKLQSSAYKIVYLDTSDGSTLTQFMEKATNNGKNKYEYTVITFNYNNLSKLEKNDYVTISSVSNSNSYEVDGFNLYFAKTKVPYTELITEDSVYNGFEEVAVPNIPYEKYENGIPTKDYVTENGSKKIYVLNDTSVTIGTTTYTAISNEELEKVANMYVEVPKSVSDTLNNDQTTPFTFYYKHTANTEANKLYIIDDGKDAKDNKVYKNLHYTVITNDEYKADLAKYSVVSSSDPNYNKSFKLYYKYDEDFIKEELFVQNGIAKDNALYIVADSLNSNKKNEYRLNNFTVVSTEEFNSTSEFYYQLPEEDNPYYKNYPKLYYKYKATLETRKVIYVYSSKTSNEYKTFYKTDSDYVADDYKLIEPGEQGYVEGTDLYYKRLRTEKYTTEPIYTPTYYYYSSTSTVSLKADQYYVVSFYVYTQGYYDVDYNADGYNAQVGGTLPIEASVYITDTSGVIEDISLEKISTNGKWQQYYAYIATNATATSAINIKICMGNSESILGSNKDNNSITEVNGTVLFDNIKVQLINETDYAKYAVNDVLVKNPDSPLTNDSDEPITDRYADAYNNEVFVANETHSSQTFYNKNRNDVDVWNSENENTFNNMFNLDNLGSLFEGLGFAEGTDGYSKYLNLWQYYISRNVSGQGNNNILKEYQQAYLNGNLEASVILEETIYEDKLPKEDDEDEDKDESDKDEDNNDKNDTDKKDEDETDDVKFVKSTFKPNNQILKLNNTDRTMTLGVTSNTFTIEQHTYYKLIVWVYSPDEDAKATVELNSVLPTASAPTNGTLLQTTATVDANLEAYSKEPTNEYGWIPVTFYIEGNALHNQDVSLVLSSSANSVVYFDNISIERTTSAAYDTASSDSDTTTYVLSLTPSSSVITNGITNGYFNTVTVTDYENTDAAVPKTAKNWTVESINSTGVIAGIIPTSTDYLALAGNFFNKNSVNVPFSTTNLYTNVFAINAPTTIESEVATAKDDYQRTSLYKIYSSSMSLTASSTYKLTFEFYADENFSGNLDANIYYGSVDTNKVLSNINERFDNTTPEKLGKWHSYSFYVQTSTASATIYLELGVENATGIAYFQKATSITKSMSVNEIRDEILGVTGNPDDSTNIDNALLNNVRFIDLANSKLTVYGTDKDAVTNLYSNKEYSSALTNTSNYTVGETGVAIASFYNTTYSYSYAVTIDKIEYYIKEFVDEETGDKSYKLYSDSFFHEEVTTIDGKPITVSKDKVTVGAETSETDYTPTETKKANYMYHFTEDYTVNNTLISKDELKNAYSSNVLILSNSYDTDYISLTPVYTTTLKTSSFYVLKIYVKTSDFASDKQGLNIEVSAVTTSWKNINTTTVESESKDEQGFVCYQVLIESNTSSISSLGVKFSLGAEANTCKGYAIVAGVELVPYSTEKLFDEYVAEIPEDDTTAKKFFGNVKATTTDDKEDSEAAVGWATFFYIFSSILLGVVLIMALVAVIIKKHPIKKKQQFENDHEKDNLRADAEEKKKGVIEVTKEPKVKKNPQDDNNNEGFI